MPDARMHLRMHVRVHASDAHMRYGPHSNVIMTQSTSQPLLA